MDSLRLGSVVVVCKCVLGDVGLGCSEGLRVKE